MNNSSPSPSTPGSVSGISADVEASQPWPVRPARLAIPVVAALVDRIVSGAIPAGSSLPAESALSTSFGISRSVLREAVKLLEEKGLAHARQGQGTVVTPADEWNLLDPIVLDAAIRHDETMQILDDLVEVRVSLESLMIRAAARRMSDADLEGLFHLLTELESQVKTPERYQETDMRFHDYFLRCSGNRLGRSIIHTIHPYARASTRYNPVADEEDIHQSHRGHVAIYEHLLQRDSEGAAAALEDHISGTWALRKQKRNRPVGAS
jgi:DNA-binding FadR family transcriptional regulator